MAIVNRCLRTKAVAEKLGVTEEVIHNMTHRRLIPFRKIKGRLFFLENEIDKWIEDAPGNRLKDI